MLLCFRCNSHLVKSGLNYFCPNCHYSSRTKNNIINFTADKISKFKDYNLSGLDTLYNFEEENFWFKTRKALILKYFEKYIQKNESIIEIGAGTGNISSMLSKNTYKNISVGEIYDKGLIYAKKYGLKKLYQFDILKNPFKNHFNVVAIFDVLEHIDDDIKALKNIHQMLKKCGKIIITVPAYQWLYSGIDAYSHHKRRYSLSQLKIKLENAGFKILDINYFFASILPLIIFRSFINKNKKDIDIKNQGFILNPIINNILYSLTLFEIKYLRFNFGSSIIAIAQKNEDSI